jgi:hypothetical protein
MILLLLWLLLITLAAGAATGSYLLFSIMVLIAACALASWACSSMGSRQ